MVLIISLTPIVMVKFLTSEFSIRTENYNYDLSTYLVIITL